MRKRVSPGLVLGVVAVVLACTGSAAAGSLITSGKIKDGTIRGRDIRKGTITTDRLSAKVQHELKRSGTPGLQGPKGDKGDKGDTGATGPSVQGSAPQPAAATLPAAFSTSSSFTESDDIDTIVPVTLTSGGVKFGPYADGGTQGGSLRYDGLDGKKLSELTNLAFTFTYTSDDHPTAAVPYMRVFTRDANGDDHDIVLDPSECAQVKVPEGTEQTRAVESVDYLRYDDDACTPNNKKDWSQMVADHGDETITAIKVSEGFAGGENATAFVSRLVVNGKTFSFPG
jgi:hypothetical protein